MKRNGICAGLAMLWVAVVSADDYWKGAAGVEGDWNDSANWLSGVVPDAEIGFVDNGGYAVIPNGSFLTNVTIAMGPPENSSTSTSSRHFRTMPRPIGWPQKANLS